MRTRNPRSYLPGPGKLAHGGSCYNPQRIAANAPLSVRAAKQTVYLAAEHGLSQAYEEADRIWAPVYRSADAQEGPAAFRDKRRPVWTGR